MKAVVSPRMDPVAHFEIPADDMVQAPGNISGGMLKRQAPIDRMVITVQVHDVEASLKAVERNGGKGLRGKALVRASATPPTCRTRRATRSASSRSCGGRMGLNAHRCAGGRRT